MSQDASDDKRGSAVDPDEATVKPRRGRIGDGLRRSDDRVSYWQRRRDKIREEIERNRRGEYVVPTWVLVIALIAVIAGWAAIVIFA